MSKRKPKRPATSTPTADDAAVAGLAALVVDKFAQLRAARAPDWSRPENLSDDELCRLLIRCVATGNIAEIALYAAMAHARGLAAIALPRVATGVALSFLERAK